MKIPQRIPKTTGVLLAISGSLLGLQANTMPISGIISFSGTSTIDSSSFLTGTKFTSFENGFVGAPSALTGDYAGTSGAFNGLCQLWHGQPSGLFTNLNASWPGLSSSAVARGDFDNDGRLDLLLAGLDNGGAPRLEVSHNGATVPGASAPRITRLETLDNRSHQISFAAPTGFGYTAWTSLGTPNEDSPASFRLSDHQTTGRPAQYYRLSRP